MINLAKLEARFHFHPTTAQTADVHAAVRQLLLTAAQQLVALCPGGPELEKAIDLIDSACMHANADVARNSNDLTIGQQVAGGITAAAQNAAVNGTPATPVDPTAPAQGA